ncbi:unnamed protein product [Prunus armeniaca]|uniref:Uncharacterized protein n=1 Tax=Prunus armeniaca TaxID=36596 RepID=A0A6J5W6F9_PRUAR|nr:unnamed protein product [Prunus armeniaca]CAB4297189.1 unnamed protein product [Prunus armeniaca]
MNPPLGEMLIGAVQPCLDFVVADFKCLQHYRRKQSALGLLQASKYYHINLEISNIEWLD